jgi:hypothetical protein
VIYWNFAVQRIVRGVGTLLGSDCIDSVSPSTNGILAVMFEQDLEVFRTVQVNSVASPFFITVKTYPSEAPLLYGEELRLTVNRESVPEKGIT